MLTYPFIVDQAIINPLSFEFSMAFMIFLLVMGTSQFR
jgi:hypothetical protein